MSPLTAEEVDRALARIGADCDLVAERLVLLDGHQGQRLLDGATLSPASQRRWAAAKAATDTLWTDFEAYRTALSTARELRAQRLTDEALGRLTTLLRDRAVEVSPATGGTELASFAELSRRMSEALELVLPLVTEAAQAWTGLAQRLDPLTERLAAATATATDLGAADDPDLTGAHAELAVLRSADPLALPVDLDDRLRAAGVRLDRATERLDTLRRLREAYPQQRAELVATLDRLAGVEAEAVTVHDTVLAKIAATPPVPPTGAADRLRGFLPELDELRERPDWTRLARRYAEVRDQADAALAAADRSRDGLRELLQRRDELRGRLDAYRAKAGRLGHSEDLTLLGLHRQAHDLLFVAPCDLAAATRAVAGYQKAVNDVVRGLGDVRA